MKRFFIVVVFSLGVILTTCWANGLHIFSNVQFNNLTRYSYLLVSDESIGDIYILRNNTINFLSFGECAYIEEENFNIEDFLISNNIEIICINNVSKDGVTLYVLYCNKLPKYRLLNNMKYNIQLAISNNFIKIGYPAIFDSF